MNEVETKRQFKVACRTIDEFYAAVDKMLEMGYTPNHSLYAMWVDRDLDVCYLVARKSGKLNWGWSEGWFDEQRESEISVEQLLGGRTYSRISFEV